MNESRQYASFWSRVDKSAGPDACWPFLGSRTRKGYGLFTVDHKCWIASRLSFHLTTGRSVEGLVVCHRCDNPPCCNPAHLFLGTPADNVLDCLQKGRLARGSRSGLAKLNEAIVVDIKRRLASGESAAKLARDVGVDPTTIHAIQRGKTWGHVSAPAPELESA